MICTVVFDLDNTLCDYRTAMRNAKRQVGILLKEQGVPDLELFWQQYHEHEPGLYRLFLNRTITRDEYRLRRYADRLQGVHPEPEALSAELNRVYMQEANHRLHLYDDAAPLLARLRAQGVQTAVLTNGPTDGQRDKFAALRLGELVDKLFCSEEIGYSKPDPRSFHHVLSAFATDAATALMIGDSLETDIDGAIQAGMHSLLLDRTGQHADYRGRSVQSLHQVSEMLHDF